MLSEKLIEFLRRPVLCAVSSRDDSLQPHAARGYGPVGVGDGDVLTIYLAKRHAARVVGDCAQSGRVALVACDVTNFQTYQFKGAFVSQGDAGREDHEGVDRYLEEAKAAVRQIGFPEALFSKWEVWNCKPCVAVRFKVEEVFHQTPGPGTGNRVEE